VQQPALPDGLAGKGATRARPSALTVAEMVLWSLVLPVLRRVVPIRLLVSLMWSPSKLQRSSARELELISLSAKLVRLRPRLRANCLERSLLAYRFLSRAGAEPRLVLGVGRSRDGVVGHAWVTLDGEPIHDSQQAVSEFTPLIAFGAAGLPDGADVDVGTVQLPRVWR
jgi:Transglutaminase-like superfamily